MKSIALDVYKFVSMKPQFMLKRLLIIFIAATAAFVTAFSSERTLPQIGAQVFIEPGQTREEIDGYFKILEEQGLKVARIRLFGSHIMKKDGSCDFDIYDCAFESAARHGVKIFATLFPETDELADVGGFKFPSSEKHLESVGSYIDNVVSHFKDAPALYAWVLQNEPGTGTSAVRQSELSALIRKQWNAGHPAAERNGYLQADFSDRMFQRDYLTWYMKWINDRISALDSGHVRHVNPHQILGNLPEYDFTALRPILTSLGASMHASWHFGFFHSDEFPLGISVMSDIIRSSALGNPFWITEMQGGNVTASGNVPVCPTSADIARWLWTGIGAGAEGIMFWTLNPRKAVSEAGEWGMLTFTGKPSGRLSAAAEVEKVLKSNEELFSQARPVKSPVSILYNKESLWIQSSNYNIIKDNVHEERGKDAVMKSVCAAYKAFASQGLMPEISDMDYYDWTVQEGKTIILPDIVCIHSRFYDSIRMFVRNGGRIIATGLTGYYDETMGCSFMGGFPLKDVFGASLSEVKVVDGGTIPFGRRSDVPVGLWKGNLELSGAEAIASDNGEIYASRNKYGAGEVVWIPSMVDLGCWHHDMEALSRMYSGLCADAFSALPLYFSSFSNDVIARTMTSGDGIVTIFVNSSSENRRVRYKTQLKAPQIIYSRGKASVGTSGINIPAEGCVVVKWN